VVHIINYKNWNKRRIGIFNNEISKKSNLTGLFNLLNVPYIDFNPNDEDLMSTWEKHRDHIFGIIMTGSSYDLGDPLYPAIPMDMLNSGIPILGICYGHQYLMKYLGATLIECNPPIGDYGTSVATFADSPIFNGLGHDQILVEMRHHLMVDPKTFPSKCELLAETKTTPIAGFYSPEKNWWGMQFHPEKNYLYNIIFKNFVKICHEKL
jgi:GMP synthase-like glutamine amidotransferase